MTQTMLNFFNYSSGKLIIFVEGAGFEPAFTSKPYKPIIRGFEPPPCAHHCASVTPYYQFNMCVYHSATLPIFIIQKYAIIHTCANKLVCFTTYYIRFLIFLVQ